MSYSASNVIKIQTRISAAGLSTADFGSAMLFVNASDLKSTGLIPADSFHTFSSTEDLSDYFGSDTEAYTAASVWLGGTPTVNELKVYVRNSADSSWATTLDKARNQVWWYWTFVTEPVYESSTDVTQIAAWCETNASMFVNCQTGDNATAIRSETVTTDIATALTTAGYRHCYTAVHASDAYSGIYLAKHFATVNYRANNSTITGEFKKSSGLTAEDLTASEYTAMKKDSKKATFYSVVDLQGSTDQGRWLNTRSHSTYGEWIDDIVNLDAFVNALNVGLYNVLAGSTTKLPQTPRGQAILIGAAKAVCERYIANGFLGERTYTDPDDAVEKTSRGYEILTEPEDILDLSDSDRANRKAAPIQIRVFRAGAIHTVDITVDVY